MKHFYLFEGHCGRMESGKMIQNYIRQSVQDIWFSLYIYRLLKKRNRLYLLCKT